MLKKIFVFPTLILIGFGCLLCCTGFVTVSGKRILIGNNEDNSLDLTDTVVRVIPATEGKYGCLLIGFNQQSFSMGGINDQGLYYDWFSVPSCDWESSLDKLDYPKWMPLGILEECANLEEAISFCWKYNLPIFKRAQVFLVDKTGASAIIAWGEGDIEVIRREGDFQVITNFYVNYPQRGGFPCYRYDRAEEMLEDRVPTIELCRVVLDAVHQELSNGKTQYSNICNLQSGDMYVYNNSHFEEFVKFNINTELEKGGHTYQIPGLLSQLTLLSPETHVSLNSTSVTLEWQGKETSQYTVHYSKNSDFSDSEQIGMFSSCYSLFSGAAFMALFGGIFLFPFAGKKQKGHYLLYLLIFGMLLLHGCQADNTDEQANSPFQDYSLLVENLESNTTYYWKVTAQSSDELTSESITRTFTTGN